MKGRKQKLAKQILEYQPDALEIEQGPVPGRVRWVLYIIIISLIGIVAGAFLFQIDRIVTAQGKLITTSPTIIVQSLHTALIRSIDVEVGDVVHKGQLLATLDPTFASADLNQLNNRSRALQVHIRRVEAEISGNDFKANADYGEEGKLQEALFLKRRQILNQKHRTITGKKETLKAKLTHVVVLQNGQKRQLKLLRDVEGETAKLPRKNGDYQLRLLEVQKAQATATNEIEALVAEETVVENEIEQVQSEWDQFKAEWYGELLHQKINLRNELAKINDEIRKARRLHDLVSLRAPEDGTVLMLAERSVGSIVRQAEPFITLVPGDSSLEAEIDILSKDIARIQISDPVRIKLDAFPFQKHGTLLGEVRVISEDAFQPSQMIPPRTSLSDSRETAFYKTRVQIKENNLQDIPQQFRLLPGMKVRAEIKVGQRRIISYFLYPVIRALDEGLREP